MAEKKDSEGRSLGPYRKEDLDIYYYPQKKRKGTRRVKLGRLLEFEPIFQINEMQLKIFIKPKFPRPVGPQTMQLAEQLASLEDMYTRSAAHATISITGNESVSVGLKEDVKITARSKNRAAQLLMGYEYDEESPDEGTIGSELGTHRNPSVERYEEEYSLHGFQTAVKQVPHLIENVGN